jgi:phosphoribosylformylglycinamidine synthase
MYLPVRHGEGKLVARYKTTIDQMFIQNQIAMQYADDGWKPTRAIAGVCDPTGRIFGLMPHPEAYLFPYNHPSWTRLKIEGKLPEEGEGLKIFKNAVDYFS